MARCVHKVMVTQRGKATKFRRCKNQAVKGSRFCNQHQR